MMQPPDRKSWTPKFSRIAGLGVFCVVALLLAPTTSAQETVNQAGDKVDAEPRSNPTVVDGELVSRYGYTTQQLGSVETIAALIAEAERETSEADAEIEGVQISMLRASAKIDVVDDQLDLEMPKGLRAQLTQTASALRVWDATISGELEATQQAASGLRRKAKLLQALKVEYDESIRTKQEKEAERLTRERKAQRAEDDAVLALEQAKDREARERDQNIKRLLARETELAERNLELTRTKNERIKKATERTAFLRDACAAEQADILEKLDARKRELSPSTAQKRADQLLAKIVRSRRQTRKELLLAFEKLAAVADEIDEAQSAAAMAREEVAEEKARQDALGASEIWKRRLALATSELELEAKRVENLKVLQETWLERRELLHLHAKFLEDSMSKTLPFASSAGARESYRLSDSNVRDVFDAARLMYDHVLEQVMARKRQLTDLDVTVDLFTWVGGLVFKFVPLILLLFFLPWLPEILGRLYRGTMPIRFFRKRPAATIKAFELVYFLARPVGIWVCIRYIAWHVGEDVWLLSFVPPLVDWVVVYVAVRDIVSIVFLARNVRDPEGNFNRDLKLGFQERSLQPIEIARDKVPKLVKSVRVFLVFWIAARIIPNWVEAVTGIGVLSRWVSLLASWGLVAIGYWIISSWRDEIGELFVKLAQERLPWAAKLVEEHRHRFYGVVIVAFASIYVLVFETSVLGRKHLLQSEWFNTARNFVFRKRIELKQRERDEEAGDAGDQALPNDYTRVFTDAELEDDDVFVDRAEYAKDIKNIISSWHESKRMGSIALVAEEGMGRSTLVSSVLRDESVFEGLQVERVRSQAKGVRAADALGFVAEMFGFEDSFENSKDLIDAIITAEPRVLVMDDCHRFFMRRIGGFDGLDVLLEVVTLTDHVHFWLLSFSRYAWDYINRVRPRVHQFGDVVELAPWSETEIQRLIEFRNARVDFAIDFTGLLSDRESDEDFYEVVKSAQGYFRYLHEFCGGNPRLALLYWLRSLSAQDDTVYVTLFHRPKLNEFSKFTDDHWFVLTALAQHGELNAVEISSVINSEPGFCALALNYLSEVGVVSDQPSGRSKLAPLYFRQVLKRLSDNNFLYT